MSTEALVASPPPPVAAPGVWAKRLTRLRYARGLWAWLLLAPALLTLLLVAAWPLLTTAYLSFTDSNLLSLDDKPNFVGLANYLAILRDPDWWLTVKNTLVFTVCSVSIETLLGLAIALLLNQNFRGRAWLRAAVLVPWAIPTVISAKMWTWMFNDMYGVINHLLMAVGILHEPVAWLASSGTAMAALVLVDVWKTTPFMALLILAGLQLIPKDVYEAAKLDSNSDTRTFWAVTLPLLKPTLAVAIIFRSLDALRIFDLVYVFTGNTRGAATMTVYARQRLMEFQEFGYGSAVSVLIFLIIGIFTVLYLRLIRPPREAA